jgi:dihydroorotate dehydrogenase
LEEKIMSQNVLNKQSTHSLAVISLVLSILGFMPVLPVIGSIAGIITGYIARRNIAANPAFYSGDGLAKAGIVLGWIGVALLVLVVAGLVLFMAPLTFTTVQHP